MKLMISDTVQVMFQAAVMEAKTRKHEFVTPEHLLWMMVHNSKMTDLITRSGGDPLYIKNMIQDYFNEKIPVQLQDNGQEPTQSLGLQNVFDRAIDYCIGAEKKIIGFNDLIVGLLDEERNHSSFFMYKSGIDRLRLLQLLHSEEFYDDGAPDIGYIKNIPQKERGDLFVEVETVPNGTTKEESEQSVQAFQDFLQGKAKNASQSEKSRGKKKTYLERFTINLTEKAAQGLLPPLIGREKEIERTIQILCRKQKNNPLHVGGAGVGKTAITYGLAQRIAEGNVPSFLKNSNIYSLSIHGLIAGAKFRGDFEDRLKRIIDEIKAEKNSIIFIDEIHAAADTNNGNGTEAADLLKPVLTGENIRCIGATTHEDYERYFSANKAFARRFQKIDIEEPSEDEALKILKGLRPSYEEFHHVHYSDEVLKAAVHLSALHIHERLLPDKAIDLIDEAGAFLKIQAEKEALQEACEAGVSGKKPVCEVRLSDIDKIVAKTAKIPEQAVSVNEIEKLRNFEDILSKKIFGQTNAVLGVTKAVKRSRAGFRAKDKPIANFLFVGPTGVGKTELAKTIAEELGISLIRFDMSEYQEKHTISRLVGSPPGYVGFEDGGLLTDAVRKQPNSVLLLDEIEKAHSDIFNILLQIMDYATLTDSHGRKANFGNIILIMTSNAGTAEIGKPLIGFAANRVSEYAINEAVEKTFTPEFRNRLDAVIKFDPLTLPVMRLIIKKEIEKLELNLNEKEIQLELEEEVIPLLAEKGYSPEYGARNAARLVEDEFVTPLTDMILFGTAKKGDSVICRIASKTKKPYLNLVLRNRQTNI